MKRIVFALTLLFLFSIACKEQTNEPSVNDIQIADLAKFNMKIIPESPTSSDEIKLIIFDDCKYNTLSGIKKTGKTINIEKQFNSMMKLPCMIMNDTILIGKLPQGTYTVNYKLRDLSTLVSDPVALSFSFSMPVYK